MGNLITSAGEQELLGRQSAAPTPLTWSPFGMPLVKNVMGPDALRPVRHGICTVEAKIPPICGLALIALL